MNDSHTNLTSFVNRILGKNLSLEHVIFLYGATAGIILSAFGTISNLIMGLNGIAILVPLINLIIDVTCVIYSIITKKWRGAALIVFIFASFVLFPFLWFFSGGTMGSSLPLIIGLGVILVIIFNGKLRGFFFFSTLLLYSCLILLELRYPNNFIPYPNREAWYIDILFGFVLSFLASGGLAYFTLLRYNVAQEKTKALLYQLEKTAITDPLTNVFNRRYLMACIDEEMRKSFDNNNPLALCILDLDHFKHINDTYGHIYGDEVLTITASTLLGCLNKNEILGRYGGEEFVVIFSNSDLSAALKTIDKFYIALQNIEWSHGSPITISGGISIYTKGISYSDFLGIADSNLYKAKNNGRNRIEY